MPKSYIDRCALRSSIRFLRRRRISPGVGPKIGKLLDKLVGQGERCPRHRSSVSPADEYDRPPPPREDRRRAARPDRDDRGDKSSSIARRRRARARRTKCWSRTRPAMFCSSSFSPIRPGSKRACRSARGASSPASSNSGTGIARWCIPIAWSMPRASRQMPLVEPVYGLTEGLAPRALAKIIGAALARLPKLPDWLAESRAKPPNLPASPRRSQSCIIRRARGHRAEWRRRGCGSPMTNCSRINWRSL